MAIGAGAPVAPVMAAATGTGRAAIAGRWSCVINPPSQRRIARSIAFRSSRTLPGHG